MTLQQTGIARVGYCGTSTALRLTVVELAGQTPAPDLTTAASATLLVTRPCADPATWTATLGTLTTTSAQVVHPWAVGDLLPSDVGTVLYVVARIVLTGGAVYLGEPFALRVIS